MNKNLLQYLASKSITGLKCDISGICTYSGELITEEFIKNGFSDFYVIEGYVKVPGWTGRTNHTWIELHDETIIDPVFDQFPPGTERLSTFKKKCSAIQYMKSFKKESLVENNLKRFTPTLDVALKEFFNNINEAAADKPPAGDKKSEPTDGPKDGGGLPDGADDIFGDASGGPGGPDIGGGPGGGGDAGAGDEKNKITQYSEKIKAASIIKFQKMDPEPGYKFEPDDKFYSENYVGKTTNGSIILAITDNKKFLSKFILPKIVEVVKNALNQKKRIVLLGDNGMPFANGKYSSDISGTLAKYLNAKYKGGYIIFDTWSPTEYYAFISNDDLWQRVKEKTEAKSNEIKSALYLYLLTTLDGRKFANKLKTENVIKTLESWGIHRETIDTFTLKNINAIAAVVYPEVFGHEDTLASFIIKTYLQSLRVSMVKKVFKYEKDGKIVIVLADTNTAWSLKPTFDSFDKIKSDNTPKADAPGGKEPVQGGEKQAPPKEAGAGKEQPAPETPPAEEKPEPPTKGKQ